MKSTPGGFCRRWYVSAVLRTSIFPSHFSAWQQALLGLHVLQRTEQAVPADLAGMSENRQIGRQALADVAGLPDSVRRVDGHKDEPGRGDDVLTRHKTPVAAVVRITAIVAHDEIIV